MTRKSLRRLLSVSGESLASVANTDKLREDVANQVLDSYRELAKKFPDDPGVRFETALVYHVIGGIERTTGQFVRSLESYDRSIDILTKLSVEDPASTEYKRWLTEAYKDRGSLYLMNGKSRDAERDCQEAITQAEGFLTDPIHPNYRRAKGAALINLTDIHMMKKEPDPAKKAADQAVALLAPLADVPEPAERTSYDRWLMALALSGRGTALRQMGETADAIRDFEAAEHYSMLTLEEDPQDADARYQRNFALIRKGEILGLDPKTQAEGLNCFEESAIGLDSLIKDFRLATSYREGLAHCLRDRASVHLAMRRLDLAEKDALAGITRLEALIDEQSRSGVSDNAEYLSALAQTLEVLSRIEIAKGNPPASRDLLTKAIEKLMQCVRLDSFRRIDEDLAVEYKARLEKQAADGRPTGTTKGSPPGSKQAGDQK